MALLRSSTVCENPVPTTCEQIPHIYSSSSCYGRFPQRQAIKALYCQPRSCVESRRRTWNACASLDAQENLAIKFVRHGSAVLEDVPHLTDWLPDLPTYDSPLYHNPAYATGRDFFVGPYDVVARNVVVPLHNPGNRVYFRRAGPSDKVYFKAEEVRACVVTCGGLCPGLNTVIREIVCGLWNQYGVRDIFGIEGGYRGFYARNTVPLNPKNVNDIHKRGGTVLGTSRGGHDTSKIVNSIEDRGINQVYIIGGDGTQKGAAAIYKEVRRRGLKVNVTGIPKTIDNDICVIDRSFGFDTAVEEAQRAINAAHTEAESCENGIGLVKLMGRYSGYIAMYATLASRDVDLCLIPEVPFYLEGEGGLYDFVQKRLRENGHMVIVVAEGAGQELVNSSESVKARDASGNQLLLDIGLWLSRKLKDRYNTRKEVLNLKYIDPTYMIRAIPSNAADNVYCTLLAQFGIHGAMAGYSGFTVGPVNGRHCYIPISRVTEMQNRVNISDRMWARLLSSTNQPAFIDADKKITEELELEAKSSAVLPDSAAIARDVPSQTTAERENSNGIILKHEPAQKTE
ncbi:hypothetical protein GOP47_0005622 [Adiantum capillus-veneris]|uniref:ATP-dependent 6-phosphofructokinase n=1 Tax=Adiantum capillus-veneris TaxID=13818 RepID=A0A9D4V5Q6_ADICA|nr:hypothetical protein GOP47_0005622 [Adiantum capillus-veneris]